MQTVMSRAMPHMPPIVEQQAIVQQQTIRALQNELAAARAAGREAVDIGHELVQFVRELLDEIEFQESLVDELWNRLPDSVVEELLDQSQE